MQGAHVGERFLRALPGGDVAVPAADHHVDVVAVEHGQRVLEAHAELADHDVGAAFLVVLLLREVLVTQPAAEVGHVPRARGILGDHRFDGPGESVLVEGVGDDLADREGHRPVLQHPLDVQVEELFGTVVHLSSPVWCR